jgi:hypothetical protein
MRRSVRGLSRSIAAAVLLGLLAACAAVESRDQEELTPADRGELFLPSADPVADVGRGLDSARENDRLALIVLGGNWCHDSRALAARLRQPPLRGVVEQHYETVFVDVGYLDQGKAVMHHFGLPVYYATPTVLIVDPVSGRLVNRGNRHQWGAAHGISMDDSVAYFEAMAAGVSATGPVAEPEQIRRLLEQIDAYERRLAEHTEQGYARVGPMLRAYKEGLDVPDSFDADWQEVSEFRNAIPALIEALRAEARQRVAAGEEGIELSWSPIAPYSWQRASREVEP